MLTENKTINKIIYKENCLFEIKKKKWILSEIKKNEDWFNRNESIKNLAHKIKKNDMDSIDNWSNYKPIDLNLIKNKIKKLDRPIKMINLNIKNKYYSLFIQILINNLKEFKRVYTSQLNNNFVVSLKNVRYNLILDFYKNIIIKKINNFKLLTTKIKILIINIKKLKFNITVMNNNNCYMSLNSGYIFKKLQLKNKKYKKASKLIFIGLKTILLKNNHFKNFNKLIVLTRGVNNNKNYNKIFNYLNNNIVKKNKKINITFINSFEWSKNKFFKFKKIKSIKRRLKKKNQKK